MQQYRTTIRFQSEQRDWMQSFRADALNRGLKLDYNTMMVVLVDWVREQVNDNPELAEELQTRIHEIVKTKSQRSNMPWTPKETE